MLEAYLQKRVACCRYAASPPFGKSPWLADVFVAPNHRRHRVGAALVRRAVDDATALGVRRLYLYTPNTELFYSRLGWSLVERTRYRGTDVVVMSYDMCGLTKPLQTIAGTRK